MSSSSEYEQGGPQTEKSPAQRLGFKGLQHTSSLDHNFESNKS